MSLRACWIVPDDRGGGVVSVAEGACRQLAARGAATTLLMMLTPRGHLAGIGGATLATLDAAPPYAEAPARLLDWLARHPQDIVLFNGCDQFDDTLPFVPAATRSVYCVHDTARRYFAAALRHEASLDAIVAVSETVAREIRPHLRDPGKLRVIHNGTVFPQTAAEVLAVLRADALIFMGGDNPVKGSDDVLRLWPALLRRGFAGTLHWFGALDPHYAERIRALPDAERIIAHGRRPRPELFAVATTCKVHLMLSRVEPFGMATIEAMGAGCLPVAWDIDTGTSEIVAPEHRHFAPLGDVEALAGCVLAACRDHAAIAPDSTRHTIARFDEREMGAAYARLLDELVAAPGVVRPRAGGPPPPYAPPRRYYQFVPSGLRARLRRLAGRFPRLGYLVRDLRGL